MTGCKDFVRVYQGQDCRLDMGAQSYPQSYTLSGKDTQDRHKEDKEARETI